MMKRTNLILTIALLVQGYYISAGIEDFYTTLFGAQDASSWYQEATKKALKDFGHAHPESIKVKQMNGLASLFVGKGLYSFSMLNIWYDENILNHLEDEERLFVIYHEAAHIMYRHHQQFALSLIPAAALISLVPSIHGHFFGDQPTLVRYSAYLLEWLVAGVVIDKAWIRPWVKTQEKWADLEAARVLCATGRQDVVDAHIASLGLLVNLGYNHPEDWHYSLQEQLNYLKPYQSREVSA